MSERNLQPPPPVKQQRRPTSVKILRLDGVVLGNDAQVSRRCLAAKLEKAQQHITLCIATEMGLQFAID